MLLSTMARCLAQQQNFTAFSATFQFILHLLHSLPYYFEILSQRHFSTHPLNSFVTYIFLCFDGEKIQKRIFKYFLPPQLTALAQPHSAQTHHRALQLQSLLNKNNKTESIVFKRRTTPRYWMQVPLCGCVYVCAVMSSYSKTIKKI